MTLLSVSSSRALNYVRISALDLPLEESYIAQVEYGFDLHDVEIIDTAGQEEFLLFRDSSISHGDAFLMLFSIDQLSSWHTLQELRKKIVREKEDEDCKVPIVIVANKKVCVSM